LAKVKLVAEDPYMAGFWRTVAPQHQKVEKTLRKDTVENTFEVTAVKKDEKKTVEEIEGPKVRAFRIGVVVGVL
jgi:hypothetical protein